MHKRVENFCFLLFFAALMIPLSLEVAPKVKVYFFDFPLAVLYLFLYLRICLRQTRLSFTYFDLFFFAFYAWLFVSSFYGKDFDSSLEWLLYWLRAYLIIFYMRHSVGTLITQKMFFAAIGFCLLLEPGLAIFQTITQSSVGVVKQYFGVQKVHHSIWLIYGDRLTRAQGTFEHTNYLGNWLVMLMPFLQTRMTDEQKKIRLPYMFWWLFCLLALILTFSRANWVAFLFGFAVVVYFEQRYRKGSSRLHRWLTYSLIPVIILVIGYTLFSEEVELGLELVIARLAPTFADKSSEIRSDLVQGAWMVMKENFFMGVGLGNSKVMILESNPFIPKWFKATVHNIYLIMTTESGLIGGILFFIIIYWPVVQAWKVLRRSTRSEVNHETMDNVISFLGCFAGLHFAMLWYVGMLNECEFPLIMTLLGAALGISARALNKAPVATTTDYLTVQGYPLVEATL